MVLERSCTRLFGRICANYREQMSLSCSRKSKVSGQPREGRRAGEDALRMEGVLSSLIVSFSLAPLCCITTDEPPHLSPDPQMHVDWLDKEAQAQRRRLSALRVGDSSSSSGSSSGSNSGSNSGTNSLRGILPKEIIQQLKVQQLSGSNSTTNTAVNSACTTVTNSVATSRQASRRTSISTSSGSASTSSGSGNAPVHDRNSSNSKSLLGEQEERDTERSYRA